jgi:3' terminal RNA ribose 2'-O-methyltransferase Hen1
VLLTVTTTHEPATDLGYLLVKHPDRVHEFEIPSGRAYVCFPEADVHRCTAALIMEIDPRRLVGSRQRKAPEGFALGQFVNDRPYAASSLLVSAMNKAFRTAMGGRSKDRPELAATAIPLELKIPALRCRGGMVLAERLFEPLGWSVDGAEIPLDLTHPEWGTSPYVNLTLTGTLRLADALNHVYVLLPVLDDAKHYWVSPDEVDKLIRAGSGWLATHPDRGVIVDRYLRHRRALTAPAQERLVQGQADPGRLTEIEESAEQVEMGSDADEDAALPAPLSLSESRRAAVLAALRASGAARVLDLGCGPGALLAELIKDQQFTEIVGVDVSVGALRAASRRLQMDRPGALSERQRERIRLLQSALTYRDARLRGYDAAVLMEVIEHVDADRLPALVTSVFGAARPSTVIVTTPNGEYNARYEHLPTGTFRHPDHRFEWTRAQFAAWATSVAESYGYSVAVRGIGDTDPDLGAPSSMAVFS